MESEGEKSAGDSGVANTIRDVAGIRLPALYWWTVVLVLGAGFGGIAALVGRALRPPPASRDLAAGAKQILLDSRGAPLSESLNEVLAQWHTFAVKTQQHPLLDKPAPDFTLKDSAGRPYRLKDALARGPVVLVFYYGYFCDHCVAQLFALNQDLKYFRELGVEVVAVSPDPPETTREKFAEYRDKGGAFGFPVLSDPDQHAASLYETYIPGKGDKPEIVMHGTFLIDRAGVVRWVNTGPAPFTNNRSLLGDLARMEMAAGRSHATQDR